MGIKFKVKRKLVILSEMRNALFAMPHLSIASAHKRYIFICICFGFPYRKIPKNGTDKT